MAETFTWFSKLTDVLEQVPDEGMRQRLAYAIVMYGSADIEPELEWPLNALFEAVREDIDNSRAARERGRRGGRPRKAKRDEAATEDTGGEAQGGADRWDGADTGIDARETAAETPAAAPETTGRERPQGSENPARIGSETGETTVSPAQKPNLKAGFENQKTTLQTGFPNSETQSKPIQAKPNQSKPIQTRGEGRAGAPSPPSGRGKRFKPPTEAEVEAYGLESGYRVDAAAFTAWHESKGWKVGNQPMKDWRAAVRTWWLRDHPGEKPRPQGAARKPTPEEELAAFERDNAEWLAARKGAMA